MTQTPGVLGIVFSVFLAASSALAQQPEQTPRPPAQVEDVVKVSTELVQTDVTVFDKQGRFVSGLKPDDFILRVDGKPRAISFFDSVTAGSAIEESKLAAARGLKKQTEPPLAPLDRGRTVFLFVDDMHLDTGTFDQAKTFLTRFVERDMKQNDLVAIWTASGRLGFLQQLTNDKGVLKHILDRLSFRAPPRKDNQLPPMSEYQALQIDHGNRDVLNFYVEQIRKMNRLISVRDAEAEVKLRASTILQQSAWLTARTLGSLTQAIKNADRAPGRKLLFLLSDGFYVDSSYSDFSEQLRRIVSASAHSNVVIYSVDARGLIAPFGEPITETATDPSGRLLHASQGDVFASQDGLNALARDTGGRPLFNKNDLHTAAEIALNETSAYYLLAWRPETDGESGNRFRRLEVAIDRRPELTVRVRRGFFDLPSETGPKSNEKDKRTPEQIVETEIKQALSAAYPERQLPVSLRLIYMDTPEKGSALTSVMHIPAEFLEFGREAGEENAKVELAGAVFDDEGKPVGTFGQRVTLKALADQTRNRQRGLSYTHIFTLNPGLYQVRVVARDMRSGKIGGGNDWVEVPNMVDHKLALSSIIAGGRNNSDAGAVTPTGGGISSSAAPISLDQRIRRDSFLRYLIFVYNAVSVSGVPDVVTQVQILRDDTPVLTTPAKAISVQGVTDLRRLPYAAELSLEGLPPGSYVLLINVVDRGAKASAVQRLRFEIY